MSASFRGSTAAFNRWASAMGTADTEFLEALQVAVIAVADWGSDDLFGAL